MLNFPEGALFNGTSFCYHLYGWFGLFGISGLSGPAEMGFAHSYANFTG